MSEPENDHYMLKLTLFLVLCALGVIALFIASQIIFEWAIYLIPHPPM